MGAYDDLLATLREFVPPLIAGSLVERAAQRLRMDAKEIGPSDLHAVCEAMQSGIHLFVEPDERDAILKRIASLADRVSPRNDATFEIRAREDVSRAQRFGRETARRLGARSLIAQKVFTVVGELGDNMVRHAGGGAIRIFGDRKNPSAVLVYASDAGPGVLDVHGVVSGPGPSGFGLWGVKRSVDAFRISSSRTGTHVEVEVVV